MENLQILIADSSAEFLDALTERLRGDFSVAESAFLELEPGFAQSEKYQLAITMLSRASGTWTAGNSGAGLIASRAGWAEFIAAVTD